MLQEVDEDNTECGMGTRLAAVSDDEGESLLTTTSPAGTTGSGRPCSTSSSVRRKGGRGKCHSEVDIRKSFEEFSKTFCGLKRTESLHDTSSMNNNNNVKEEEEVEEADEVEDQVGSLIVTGGVTVGAAGGKLMGSSSRATPMVEFRNAAGLRSSIL